MKNTYIIKMVDYFEIHVYTDWASRKNPLSTQKEIAKALKKSKVYSELGLLREFGFILVEAYPLRFKLNNEKIISGI